MTWPGARMAVAAVIGAVAVSGCGGGKARTAAVHHRQCRATIGFIGAAQQPLAKQQLAFARLAVANDNANQHTRITLMPAPTGDPASLAADRFAAQAVMAVVGPASNDQVQAAGPVFARAGIAFISASATGSTLTGGANPTFFRVVPSDSFEGPQLARLVTRLRPHGTVLLVDDGSLSSRQLVRPMPASLRAAGIPVASISAIEGVTPVGTLAARITPLLTQAVLAWHVPSEANQLGRMLAAQRKAVTLVGPSQLFDPLRFTTAGSYVAYWAPDITALRADASLVRQAKRSVGSFGIDAPPTYAATNVIDSAIAAVCRSGRTPSRGAVLAAIRVTDESSSVLGIPIKFRSNGELTDPHWFIFRIQPSGRYLMQPLR